MSGIVSQSLPSLMTVSCRINVFFCMNGWKYFGIAKYFVNIWYLIFVSITGCYYQYKHYNEGEQIITNEPCLNCTCHNQMLMCFLRWDSIWCNTDQTDCNLPCSESAPSSNPSGRIVWWRRLRTSAVPPSPVLRVSTNIFTSKIFHSQLENISLSVRKYFIPDKES